MPRFTPQRQEQIQEKLTAIVVTRSGLSDVSDTSVFKHLIAAIARVADEAYYQTSLLLDLFSIDTATGSDLDERAKEIQPATLVRSQSSPAAGQVVFSRATTSGSVTITTGTTVKTADGVMFTTTAPATITPASIPVLSGHITGQDSVLTPVAAVLPGSNGNVVAGTVIKFGQKPTGVDSVTNPGPFSQGSDQENDDAFRQRLKNYIAGLAKSTVQALESGVLGAKDPTTNATIIFSNAVEDFTNPGYVDLYVDDGTGQAETSVTVVGENVTQGLAGPPPNSAVGGETRMYLEHAPINPEVTVTLSSSTRGSLTPSQYTLDPASGLLLFSPALATGEIITAGYTYYTGLIALAQKIVDGDPDDRAEYPGLRAAGVQVVVRTPQVVFITVNATLTIAGGYDVSSVRDAVTQAILSYIDSLGISADVLLATLFQRIMNVAGVNNVIITAPVSDIAILDNQLARTSTSNVVIT